MPVMARANVRITFSTFLGLFTCSNSLVRSVRLQADQHRLMLAFVPMKTRCAALLVAAIVSAHPSWAQPVVRPDADPRVAKLISGISEERLSKIVQTLAGFETRNTLSDTTSPTRGIGAAREWI